MFVSFLQRFGFKASAQPEQPLQSRADQNTRLGIPSGDGGAVHPEAASQRRQAVKAKSAKSAKSAKASQSASKSKTTAKKPVKAAVSKPVVKTKAKVKVTAKPKAAPQAAAKPVAKKVAKPAVKTKSVVKKPVPKPVVKKSVPRPVAKANQAKVKVVVKSPAKPTSKATLKPVPKASVKASAKKAVRTAVKPVAKPLPKKAVVQPVKVKPVQAVVSKKESTVVPPAAAVQIKPALASNGLPPPPPLKPGRRSSSRALAHMPPPAPMVPTHAPDAAKASYSTMTERVIAPPPHVAAKKDPKLANNWKTKAAETLTDEEIKAMPDVEYMNDKQMAFFRYKLSILKQDIHNSAGATTEHLREDTAVVPDPADRATIEEEHALELRTRDRERKLLKKIEQSIARIDSGDYGYCDETGEPIGVGRLIARPTASLSLEAQQRRELKQKMFGD
ncbi:MAG: RNA polymerase-binding protein DksA [Polaromonas sp.]|nr:RNA polymerase-binding protein DksA [Polaromonas sp.]